MEDIDSYTDITESDDDILGINDDPINIRIFHKINIMDEDENNEWIIYEDSKSHCKQYDKISKSKDVINKMYFEENDGIDHDDWVIYEGNKSLRKKNNVRNRSNNNMYCEGSKSNHKRNNKITKHKQDNKYVKNDEEKILKSPEMVTINNNNMLSHDNFRKYRKMKYIRNVKGFVVNVHDATNFDIAFDILPEIHERYQDVISNQYTYQDLGEDFLINPDMNRLIESKHKIGTTYRCRLKGIGINQSSSSSYIWKSNQMCIEVKKIFDRSDGWIICTLSDIDIYQRLLVDIYIYMSNEVINLCEYILKEMESEDEPIFYPYIGKKDTI